MSRPERLHVPGGRYFVVDRFRASEVLVGTADRAHSEAELRRFAAHRVQYEVQLAYAITRWSARVNTHCWLPGCALLEIQIGWAPLEHVMHSLRGPFSRYLRKSTGLPEPVYAGRYAAWLIEPRCTLDLRRDICWRPVRAGLCRHPTEYPHTTIHYALNGSTPRFLAHSRLLAWFQQRQQHPRTQLLNFLSTAPTPEFTALLSGSPHDRRIIGHTSFVRRMHRQEAYPAPAVHPQSVIQWVRLLVSHRATTLAKASLPSTPALISALTAWMVSCSGIASVSNVTTWFHPCDRSRLERAIDHYLQIRPDLFNNHTLSQFVHYVSCPTRESAEFPFAAPRATSPQDG
ncbi:MAG: hypothetical protein WBE91_22635 [Steroidobacteraceae bacterium]